MGSGDGSDAEGYELYIGRWSRPIGRRFVAWLAPRPGLRWLDVGCGTGAVSEAALADTAPDRVTAVDISEDLIRHARRRLADGRLEFCIGDAERLPVARGRFDLAVSGLILHLLRNPRRAVEEMRRAVRGGGIVAAYVWDFAGEMMVIRHFWNAAADLDPAATALDQGLRHPICAPDALRDLWHAAGLEDISTCALDAPAAFRDFDDYWTPLTMARGPAPDYCMSLSEDRQLALRVAIRDRLPAAANGRITLNLRALAVRGRVASAS